MMNIYYDDGVQPSTCVNTCSTIEEAKDWISEQLKGYPLVSACHMCSEDDFLSIRTASFQVYDGKPITLGEDGQPTLAEPIYISDFFYTIS